MRSNQYHYLNIYSDKELSESFDTQKLKKFLDILPDLESNGPFKYKNKSSFPFIEILLLNTKNIDSWSDQDVSDIKINLIAVICSKNNDADFERIKRLLIKIASFLNWELKEDHEE